MEETAGQQSTIEGSNTIEQYRRVIARIMNDRNVTNTSLAKKLGVGRSFLGKIRKGERKISPKLTNDLIKELSIDRERLALAVLVMGKPEYYFDQRFRNAAYVVVGLLNAAMSRPENESSAIALKNLSRETCDMVIVKAIDHLLTAFSTPEGIKDLAAKLFDR
jgi:transcriptional regulator with XRE-family HTH domain